MVLRGCGSLPLAIAYARMVLCGEEALSNQACNLRVSELKHPDLHFIFPVANSQEIKTKAISANFLPQWRGFYIQTLMLHCTIGFFL
jgi:DNA polymerase-3 subunit delta'